MEQYEFEKEQNTPTIKYGYFEQKVFDKHVQAYGTDGAQKNLTTATKILGNALKQREDSSLSNNVLLVGKVQSGKTSNLEMLSALMFDKKSVKFLVLIESNFTSSKTVNVLFFT